MIVSPSPEPRARPAGFGSGGRRPLPLLLEPLLALGLLTAAVLPFLHLWYRSRVALLEVEAGARMDQAITTLQSLFLEVDGDTRLMARLPQVREAARQPTRASLDRLPPIFGAFLQSYPRYIDIELLNGQGRTLAQAVRGTRPYGLQGGDHLREHPPLLRTALAAHPDGLTISDPRWYRETPPGVPPLPILHVLLTLPREWPGRLLRADMRLDALFYDLKAQVALPGSGQEVVVLDARGHRLDQGGGRQQQRSLLEPALGWTPAGRDGGGSAAVAQLRSPRPGAGQPGALDRGPADTLREVAEARTAASAGGSGPGAHPLRRNGGSRDSAGARASPPPA
ncbi:MAG: hypothetical protein VKJ66_06325 [Synechococcus sp.]|nr:hypothetical protein [Synechococcus sp.]